jgi:hypothetical protein
MDDLLLFRAEFRGLTGEVDPVRGDPGLQLALDSGVSAPFASPFPEDALVAVNSTWEAVSSVLTFSNSVFVFSSS